ncbi:MAG: alpha/beta hydrolase, partial [Bacteroidales bacterium]|nr:alpha/beta hydrolase [Bacteroidales bacterium]
MKRLILLSVFAALPLFSLLAREYQVFGPEGGIAIKMTLPDGFDTGSDKCPMVLLMHGIFSSKDINPMPTLAKELAARGIASVRFDFDGHGKSEGRMQDMTIEKELADAKAVWDYVKALPFVSSVGLLG